MVNALPKAQKVWCAVQHFFRKSYPYGPFWYFTLPLLAANLLWLAFDPAISLQDNWYLVVAGYFLLTIFSWLGLQALTETPIAALFHRLLCIVAAYAFASLSYLQLRTQNYLSMSLSNNWADAQLSQWDKALGFDWWAYVNWLLAHPNILTAIDICYSAVDWPIGVIAVLLILLGKTNQLREFFGITFATAFICIWIATVFPAQGATATYNFSELGTYFKKPPATYHIERILALQNGTGFSLDPSKLQGLAAFPSFHTALGILLVYAARSNVYLLLAAILYSSAMIAATPLFGGHYFVDIIAGAALTFATIAIWRFVIEPKLSPLPDQPNLWTLLVNLIKAIR